MKKGLLIVGSLFLLTACTTSPKEAKTTSSSESSEVTNTTKRTSDSSRSSAQTSAASKTSTTSQSQDSSTLETTQTETSETNEEEQKIASYNQLDLALKVLLATTIVDHRAETPGLQGFGLGYNFDGNYLFVQISSGAGVGHPLFKLAYDESAIYPLEEVVGITANEVENNVLSGEAVSKVVLYDRYLNEKEKYDSSISHVQESSFFTEAYFEKRKSFVKSTSE
ncbi:hypothetical protein [Enterococcus sp. UD-01]|jgi:hypothetical protein|uniref:hypothetical protein n=1 Tax=Enterococcus sp. UD-01 TaxID=3373911 RepID=UPI003835985A